MTKQSLPNTKFLMYYIKVVCTFYLLNSHSLVMSASATSSSGDGPTTTSFGAPWQSSDSTVILEESLYEDLPPNIFSPTGRLHSVERVMNAATTSSNPTSNLVIAMACRDGIIIISTVPVSPHLNVSETLNNTSAGYNIDQNKLFMLNDTATAIVELGPTLLGATAGNAVDGQVLRHKLQVLTESCMAAQGSTSISSSEIARRLADHLQVATQTVGGKSGRMLASIALVVGNRQVWRIDPTGQFWKCYAVVIGRAADKAQDVLYKLLTQHVSDSSEDNNNDKSNNDNNKSNIDMHQLCQRIGIKDAQKIGLACMEKTLLGSKMQQVVMGGTAIQPKLRTPIYWHSVSLDYSTTTTSKEKGIIPFYPKRRSMRGAFLPFDQIDQK